MDLLDSGDWDTADIASMTGLSQRTIQRRVARARDTRAAEADPQPMVGGEEDGVWLELTDSVPLEPTHPYYDLATDATSHDGSGAFCLVGTGRGGQLRRNRLGTGRHVDTGQRYGRGQDDGLKGGVG